MAISLESIRNKILTSIRGRRLGFDESDFLAGPKDMRKAVSAATSDTTGTTLVNYGFHTVSTTTDDGWSLQDPVPGVAVRIATATTSTGLHAITPAAATIVSTNGTAGSSITLVGAGSFIELMGISTAQWIVSSIRQTTTGNAYATVSS